jgi:two-component system phosphate regulon sensor histidine kinase PhoR
VDPWPVIALLAGVGLVAAAALAVDRGRTLRRYRTTMGAESGREVEVEIGRMREGIDRLELALSDARRNRERLVDLLDAGIVELDAQLVIVAANGAAHMLVGRAPGALPGLGAIEAFLDTQIEAIARAARDQGSASGEVRLRGTDGVDLVVRGRRTTGGGAWLVLVDVSELHRLRQIRTEFIDNLSHELRTPLTTVSLLAETLSREADSLGSGLPVRMRDRISKIEVETGHLVQMVSELLDLSRIESGGTLGLIDDLDLGQLARSSTERLRLFAERQGVTLALDLAPDLPLVRGDEARLGQVFINLLHNAVKFSPNGGDVTVRVREEGGELVASVEDHGVGVPRAAQPRIFERFYKVDRARVRGEAGGTGLGLSIARHIVEQHGGRIWIASTEGVGSTFSFAIPLAHEEA